MDLSLFNDAQRQAILLPISVIETPEILVLAGAGSGKTRVLTYRIAYLIERGVDPSSILAMTFTKKAAVEMQERARALTPQAHAVYLSTFHSLCADLLRRFSTVKFDIFDDHDQKSLIKALIRDHEHKDELDAKPFMEWVSYVRAKCMNPLESKPEDSDLIKMYRELFAQYTAAKARLGVYDFDDLLEKMVLLLQKRADIQHFVHQMWSYILVDEYQDTNLRQSQLLTLIKSPETQFLQVGDEDQLIYSWRGAEIDHILSAYERSLIDTRVTCIPLLTNYRCSSNILRLANQVISVNQMRTGKSLTAHNPAGVPVKIWSFYHENDEANALASQFKTWFSQGTPFSKMAVLIRMNFLSRGLERALIDKRIPYKLHSGTAIFDTKEVRLLLNLLWLIEKPYDVFYFQQVIDVIKVGIGPVALRSLAKEVSPGSDWLSVLERYAKKKPQKNLSSLLEAWKMAKDALVKQNLAEAAEILLETSDLLSSFKEEERERRAQNVMLVIDVMRDYESETKATGKAASLSDFQEQRLLNDALMDKDDKDRLNIMSVHKAKGLEFERGAVLGMQDGLFPIDPDLEDEEDIRLAYVAITRFKMELILTRAQMRTGYNNVSPFSSITGPHEKSLIASGVLKMERF